MNILIKELNKKYPMNKKGYDNNVTHQIFKEAFIKRAQEYGVTNQQAEHLYKLANSDDHIGAMIGGGIGGALGLGLGLPLTDEEQEEERKKPKEERRKKKS